METRLAGYETDYSAIKALYVNPNDKFYTNRRWLINNEFGYVAIVFADCAQDALDIIVDDSTKLDSCLVEYTEFGTDDLTHLGNAGELFDLTYIGMQEI